MRFAFTDDQQLFADGLRDLLAKECTPAHVRAAWEEGTGHDAALWSRLGEMGVLGVLVPEEQGGFGGTDVDLVLLLEELGKAAAPGPDRGAHRSRRAGARGHRPRGRARRRVADRDRRARRLAVRPARAGRRHRPRARGSRARPTGATLTDVDGIDQGRRIFTVDGMTVEPVAFDADLAFDRARSRRRRSSSGSRSA